MPVKNVCHCHMPPGGTVTCEPDQLAICIVKDGDVRKECRDPPGGLGDLSSLSPAEATRFLNWALSHITGQPRHATAPISPADAAILTNGSYHNVATGEMITFSLPSELNLTSPSSASGSGSGGAASGGSGRDEEASAGDVAVAY